MLTDTHDTICAVATATGGAIAIIRLSGSHAIDIADAVFTPKGGTPLSAQQPYTIAYGNITGAGGELVDEVLVSVFRAPHSYTGEDSVEISCHGSAYIARTIMQALIQKGCRAAAPGEYTRRAFMNGKMDLSQAEAVADLIASTNRATHRMAMSQLRGHFSSQLSQLRDQLLQLTSLLELELDFSDHEDLEFADRRELRALTETILQRVASLAKSYETGNALKRGIPVAIVGKTNVGKSTLLNRLLGDERAIVSDVHGTTRDVIEDCIDIQGITFRFIDTAGIRKTDDVVESLGIERTYKKIAEATIVLWVIDQAPTADEITDMQHRCEGKKLIVVRNKADLRSEDSSLFTPPSLIKISAKSGMGIEELEHAIVKTAGIPEIQENDVVVTSARHYEALMSAHANLTRVIEGMDQDLSGDLLAEDLRLAIQDLASITGSAITTNEVLGNIFQHFCVGK